MLNSYIFYKNIDGINEVDYVDIIEYFTNNHIGMKSRVIRGFNCHNTPVIGNDNDFIYYVDSINDTNFTSVIAIDVRTNQIYKNNMIGASWIGWDKLILNSDLSWKTLGYYEQGVEVSLPSSFTELLVVIYINGWAFTLPITYITLTDSERGYLGGSTWNTSSNYYGYHVNCSKTKIILRNSNFGGTAAEAKAMAVYYR